MEEPTSQRQEVITKLCNKGEGLAVLFETIATVYQSADPVAESNGSAEQTDGEAPCENWEVVGYGVPSIVATSTEITLCISDLDEDLPGHEITISSSTQFMLLGDHFTVIGVHNSTYYGINFADAVVARKIDTIIHQILPALPSVEASEESSAAKRMKMSTSSMGGESDPRSDNEWVIVERKDIPEETEEPDGGATEDTDSPLFRQNTIKRRRSRSNSPLVISGPSDFRHLSHVGQDSSVGELTKSMTAGVGESLPPSKPIASHRESGTLSVNSFTEVFASGPGGTGAPPPPPPPPTAPPPPPPPTGTGTLKIAGAKPLPGMSIQDELLKGVTLKATNATGSGDSVAGSIAEELKRGVTLRPVGTLGKQLPKPPPLVNKGKLLFEINTFKRNTLRHVETKSKNMTDYQNDDPNNLQSLLKASLEKMRGKLNMRNFSRVGSINGEGNENGFEDEFDGPLFG